MGKQIIILLTLIACVGCSTSSPVMYVSTGHIGQKDMIDSAFQNAMEYNPDGVPVYWRDEHTGKSGHVKPLYASYDWAGPCRHFEIAYFYPNRTEQKQYGQACRRDAVWLIH